MEMQGCFQNRKKQLRGFTANLPHPPSDEMNTAEQQKP